MAITSVEMNYMVYRYLAESGFTNAAFTFGHETGILKSPSIDVNLFPPGALIKLVQKGLRYMEMEANLIDDENDVAGDFTFLRPMDIITKEVSELQKIVKNNEKSQNETGAKESQKESGDSHVKDKEGKEKARKEKRKQKHN